MIDRVTPTQRPKGTPQGYQRWRDLLFLHWPVPINTLRSIVPTGLELDLYDDVAYVGIVPFAMEGVRPRMAPEAVAFNFLETNVRTYVTRHGEPGVFFFSLDAASSLAVWIARQFWALPYYRADMTLHKDANGEVQYSSYRRGQQAAIETRYSITNKLTQPQLGTIEYFFLERYLLFTEKSGRIYRGQVHHIPYPAHGVELHAVSESLLAAIGLTPSQAEPAFAHYSPGVDVDIFPLSVTL